MLASTTDLPVDTFGAEPLSVLVCLVVEPDDWCHRCSYQGNRPDTVTGS